MTDSTQPSAPVPYTETTDLTTGFHIFLAIAFTCFIWICVVKPYTTLLNISYLKYLPIISIVLIAIILFIVIVYEQLYKNTLSDENIFAILKISTLLFGIIAREIFLAYHAQSGSRNFKVFTFFVMIFFMINILEASATSIISSMDTNKQELDKIQEVPNLELFSGIIGITLCVIVSMMLIRGYRVDMFYDSSSLYIKTKLGPLFILAYTFWNLLFVIQIGGLPTLLNFCSTLLLPIIVEYSGSGDWLQTRGIALFFCIIILMGFGNGGSNLLPMYNVSPGEDRSKVIKDTYDTKLMKLQETKEIKLTVTVLAGAFTAFALFYECYNMKVAFEN